MGWTLPPGARGVWVKIPAIEVIEVLAASGVDFVVIDREHGAVDLRAMTAMIAVARGLGVPALVRVSAHSPEGILPALDAGASGLFVPHVDDAATARKVVDVCRFPPMGRRHGSPTTRFGDWGAAGPAELVGRGNGEVMLVAQLETPQAVDSIDDILRVTELDAVFIGSFDLALSSGLSAGDPEFRRMVTKIEQATIGRRALGGVAVGSGGGGNGGPAGAQALFARGYAFAMVGVDTSLLADGARSAIEPGAA